MNLPPPPMDFLLPPTYSNWHSSLTTHSAYRSHGSHCSCCLPKSYESFNNELPTLSQYQASWGFFNGQAPSSSSTRPVAAMTYLAPDGHPSVPTLVPELGFSPTPSDGYSSDIPSSPTSSLESQLNALFDSDIFGQPDVHVICNAPLVAPIPLPRHLPTLFSCELPDIDEDLSHPPYMRPFKRKRASSAVHVDASKEEEPCYLLNHTSHTGGATRLVKRKADEGEPSMQPLACKKRRGAEFAPRENSPSMAFGALGADTCADPSPSRSLAKKQQPRRRSRGSS